VSFLHFVKYAFSNEIETKYAGPGAQASRLSHPVLEHRSIDLGHWKNWGIGTRQHAGRDSRDGCSPLFYPLMGPFGY